MKHTFKKVVVLALAVLMCLGSIVPTATAAESTCPGTGAFHTIYNCEYTEYTTSAATCEAKGSVLAKCNKCDATFVTKELEPTGHDWEVSSADCTTNSIKTCKVCNKTEVAQLTTGHLWGDWTVNGGICRVGEKRVRTCAICGAKDEDIMTEEHSWIVSEFAAPERCGLAGYIAYACANGGCDATRDEEVWLGDDAMAHKWVSWSAAKAAGIVEGDDPEYVEKSCTTTGQHTEVCQVCEITKLVVDGKSTTHTAADIATGKLRFINAVFENCCINTTGKHAYWKCYDCGALYQAVVDTAKTKRIEEKGTDGALHLQTIEYTYYKDQIGAAVSGNKVSNVTAIKDIADHYYTGASKSATCTEPGFDNRVCVMCGTAKNSTTAALGHLFIPNVASGDRKTVISVVAAGNGYSYSASNSYEWSVFLRLNPYLKANVVPATCATDGSYEWRCVRNGCYGTSAEGREKVTVPATGHVFSKTPSASSVSATCTLPGINYYNCTVSGCTAYTTETVQALGHKLKTTVTVPATCKATGTSVEVCERGCGYEPVVTTLPKDPANHAWEIVPGTPNTPATCITPGTVTKFCSNCGIAPATYEIPATGHKFLEGDALADAVAKVTKKGVGGTETGIKYLQAGDCTQVAKYQLGCLNGSCAMFQYHEVSEGFNVGAHDVVVVYRNSTYFENELGLEGTYAYNGIIRDRYDKYGLIVGGFTGLHGNSGFGQAAPGGHVTSSMATGKNYFWYCKNAGCPMARTDSNPRNAAEILSVGPTHQIYENGAYRDVSYTDVPDDRISKAGSVAKAQTIKAPVDENGNITAVAIDIPGTTLVWRYVVEGNCEYDEVKEGGFWCVDCQSFFGIAKSNCPPAVVGALRGHNMGTPIKVSADCQNYGFTRTTCADCGYSVVTNYKAATDHAYVVVDDVKPTCNVDGYQLVKCTTCGDSEVIIPAGYTKTGHKNILGETLTESCQNASVSNRYCTSCANVIVADHSYAADGRCKFCGRAKAQ